MISDLLDSVLGPTVNPNSAYQKALHTKEGRALYQKALELTKSSNAILDISSDHITSADWMRLSDLYTQLANCASETAKLMNTVIETDHSQEKYMRSGIFTSKEKE